MRLIFFWQNLAPRLILLVFLLVVDTPCGMCYTCPLHLSTCRFFSPLPLHSLNKLIGNATTLKLLFGMGMNLPWAPSMNFSEIWIFRVYLIKSLKLSAQLLGLGTWIWYFDKYPQSQIMISWSPSQSIFLWLWPSRA